MRRLERKTIMFRKLTLILWVVVLGFSLAIFIGWWRTDGPGQEPPIKKGASLVLPPPLGTMDFRMTEYEGKTVGPKDLLGRPSMVFFGFTFCPDICPGTLADIAGWLEDLGRAANKLNVVFISVDPDRDTPEVLADYVKVFDDRIHGWSGTSDNLVKAATAFGVKYEKVPQEDGDYTMNHTASLYLFDSEGVFQGTIDYHEPREFAVAKIRRLLERTSG